MLSVDLKERIVKWYFEDGLTYRDIRDQARVSLGLISNTIRNFQEFSGQVVNPFRRHTGRPSYLNDQDMAFIQSTLDANPSIYLDELQKRLNDASANSGSGTHHYGPVCTAIPPYHGSPFSHPSLLSIDRPSHGTDWYKVVQIWQHEVYTCS
jgi:hypothetical protein